MPDVRKIALNVLYDVFYHDAYSALSLNQAVKTASLSPLDTSFLSALTYGVLERMLLLDHIISQYSNIPLKKIEKKTLLILRLGVYQILFMDKVPDSAAVDESVKLSKKLRLNRSAGFVNAVLRNFLRNEKRYSLPPENDKVKFLSVKFSCSQKIVKILLDRYGEDDALAVLENMNGRPPLTVRVNTLKTSKPELADMLNQQGIETEEISFLENSLNLRGTGAVENIPAFQDGLFYVQDAASQAACEILGAKPGETICDVCAAPGGKSFYSAMKMENRGKIFSFDIYDHKLNLIRKTARRLGIGIIEVERRDALDETLLLQKCDRVLCDVPCSGLGIMRRKPEIRYNKDTNIDILPQLQYSILCNSTRTIPIGGIAVYSTCTLNPKENEDIVNRFLDEHPDFVPEPIALPDGLERFVEEPAHMLTLLPYRCGTDGFFVAKMRKAASYD